MNATPAHDLPRPHALTPHHDPAELVGRWTRVRGDHGDQVGVLLHATRSVAARRWEWSLRTPTGVVTGSGDLRAAPLGGHEDRATRSARRRLRAARADLAEFADAGDPALDEATSDLELLELESAVHP
ncbi:hypothetical protein BJF83_12445 [Nocardiopsis sp. CNR-923]|uniref:hypothetical protein n=1 Tax=Nocardiopsis sp. CNR-923 TaxID=1904965 RepID=UPI000969D0BD|nr:hypothetical protein [Nocardiopsis sp. CNR-923]OLT29244.1 hypothetical protein BJF83_12445 [Nocardiopsis sp. CNR-923]